MEETRKYPVSNRFDFSIDKVTEDVENAYLSLPVSGLNFRVIDLPFSDKDRVREVLPFELDGIILGGTDRVIFDCVVLGSSDDKYQVLAVYIEKDSIREILARLKSFNLDPVFVNLYRASEYPEGFYPIPTFFAGNDRGQRQNITRRGRDESTHNKFKKRRIFIYAGHREDEEVPESGPPHS